MRKEERREKEKREQSKRHIYSIIKQCKNF